MAKNDARKNGFEKTNPEDLAAKEEKFRTFFSTSVAQVPDEMKHRDDEKQEPAKQKTQSSILGRILGRAKEEAEPASSRPTNGMLMLSSMLGGVSRVGAAGAASSSPSPKKRKGWVGSGRASSGSGLRVRSSAKTIFGMAAQAFSSASNAAVSTPNTSCGAGVSASGRAGFGAGKSRALSSCISACSFCSCGVSGPRT